MKKIKRSSVTVTAILAAIALTGVSVNARADVIALTNPSFETVQPVSGGPIPGWSGSGYEEGAGFTQPLPAPADGNNYLTVGVNTKNSITQITSATVTSSGEVLTLSVADGTRSGYTFNPNVLLEFVLGSNTIDQTSSSATFTAPSSAPATGQFALFTLQYTTTAADIGQTIEIGIGAANNSRIQLDNVSLTASTVPEPSVTPLLGVGALIALAGFYRRQKSS